MVDLIRRLRIEVPDRVVAHSGEVDHRIEADQVLTPDVADVHPQAVDLRRIGAERAGGEQVRVDSEDLVSGPLQQRDQHRADVAVMTGYEYAQGNLLSNAQSIAAKRTSCLGRPDRSWKE